jgi:hypothetical protein
MAREDDGPCGRSCADCELLEWFADQSVCTETGRLVPPWHDATACVGFVRRWGSDAEDD